MFYARSSTTGVTLPSAAELTQTGQKVTATYMGSAAGKFAINRSVQAGNNESGHFTADAKLDAEFGTGTSHSITGTINGFMLNDVSEPSWSVALQKAAISAIAPVGNIAGTPKTVWSVGTENGDAGGHWEGQMYNDKDGDDSDLPSSIVGAFRSTIDNTHEMVGAFGAERR